MKMRRIRVRSLFAGCISCLRCVDQRSHMQIESLCVPPRGTPVLRVASGSTFIIDNIIIILSLSSPVAASDRSVSRSRLRAYSSHIGSLSPEPLPSVFAAALIYRCDGLGRASGPKTRRHCRIDGYKAPLRFSQKFTSPPRAAVEALDEK